MLSPWWILSFAVSETYPCLLRLKSLAEEDAVKMQAGSGETHVLYVIGSCNIL